jgi:hypothetical protein
VYQIFIHLKKTYDSVRSEGGLYNILMEFDIPMKPGRLIKCASRRTLLHGVNIKLPVTEQIKNK